MADIGRNDPCTCGSGKKYKKCCEAKDSAKTHTELETQWTKSVKDFEKEKKDTETAEAENPGTTAKNPKHAVSSVKAQRHNIPTAPKFNMPRKSGGGGA
jgi:hypothetical protein